MGWARTSGPEVTETVETLVDYHIEITSHLSADVIHAEFSLLVLIFPWSLPDIYISDISELYSCLAPFITKWASQPHITYMVGKVDRSEMFQGMQAKLLRDLTTLFIQNLTKILTYFEPGGGPMALVSSGEYVQVPPLTRVGDKIYTFKGRDETFVLRPEYGKRNHESESYIVKDLTDRRAWGWEKTPG